MAQINQRMLKVSKVHVVAAAVARVAQVRSVLSSMKMDLRPGVVMAALVSRATSREKRNGMAAAVAAAHIIRRQRNMARDKAAKAAVVAVRATMVATTLHGTVKMVKLALVVVAAVAASLAMEKEKLIRCMAVMAVAAS